MTRWILAGHNDAGDVLALFAGPPLGAVIGFNLARAYDPGVHRAPTAGRF